eukprot:GILI01016681.1.p1 GENE.GILI01016681.1~~GILI01016681.1.p1  ORF type:complete len:371 (+),score=110.26 GILI01016681.1:59-1171(+)
MRPSVAEFVSRHLAAGIRVHSAVPASVAVPVIGTHDGSFHCDEAMACGLLKHTDDFNTADVVRTRDPKELAQCNVVVDVGGVYDPKTLRYDHHQREFNDTMNTGISQYNTRLSSAGLVYRHYGKQLIQKYAAYGVENGLLKAQLSEPEVNMLFDRIYRNFVEQVDGVDNGVADWSPVPADKPENITRNYRTTTNLSARVGTLNPRWNDADQSATSVNAAFGKAVTLATSEFFDVVDFYTLSWLPARTVVQKAFDEAKNHHSSGAIAVMSAGGCPWREHLMDIEEEAGAKGRTLYVLFGDEKGWRVQAVPKDVNSFENRKSLPWKGLRDEDLSKASGIDGGVFVHVSGFIGGNKTFEGAMAMAVKAVEMTE